RQAAVLTLRRRAHHHKLCIGKFDAHDPTLPLIPEARSIRAPHQDEPRIGRSRRGGWVTGASCAPRLTTTQCSTPNGKPVLSAQGLTEAIDTTTAQGVLVFHMFSALAEFERALIRERTRAGLKAAKRMGRTGGRPAKLTEDDLDVARTLLANPDITVANIADRIGVSPATLYRYLPAARSANSPDV